MKLHEGILSSRAEIQAIRRDIHAHPELRFEEHRTAKLVEDLLRGWGLQVHTGLGGTGVVGTLKGRRGNGDRHIGLRADMDALPILEENRFAHRSTVDGKMHACGHDGHTAMLLAAARSLADAPDFDGQVHFIFQPAEELGAGAQRMIDDGLFDRFPCEAVFGMHNWPGIPVGHIAVTAGPMMASTNEFEIRIEGRGSHAALPHESDDPVLVATHLVQALQSIITRNKRPVDVGLISVTEIHTGSATNVIPDHAIIRGTARTFTGEVLDLIESRMRKLVSELPPAFGAKGSLNFVRNYPPLINHARETRICVAAAQRIVGKDSVDEHVDPTMGAEDFAFMLQAKPGCYVFIGNGEQGDHRESGHGLGPCRLHNPSYDFNDELIPIGGSYWVQLVHEYLGSTGTADTSRRMETAA